MAYSRNCRRGTLRYRDTGAAYQEKIVARSAVHNVGTARRSNVTFTAIQQVIIAGTRQRAVQRRDANSGPACVLPN
ncbi:MAG: hypothetical protein MRJ52_03210 [Nitrosomonas sp.]|nr:hypothetical protein [Nitrosomonas sp.]